MAALIRGEQAAIESYRLAAEKAGETPGAEELKRLAAEHEESLNLLQERLEALDLEAPEEAAPWDGGSLKSLKKGELEIAGVCEDALRDEAVDAEVRALIRTSLLPGTKARLPVLERLLKDETPAKQ